MKEFKKRNIPFELQVEIIKRVPVKSLIQFRSVSRQWKSLIDSSQFINDHNINQTQPHRLLITYEVDSEVKYVSIVDNDSFPHHKFSPPTNKLVSDALMLGCSHGLVCLHGVYKDLENRKKLVVVWNPSIRKFVGIALPHGSKYDDIFGFGVCPKTSDPKIVRITRSRVHGAINCNANLFTISSRAWRSIPMNLRRPLKSYIFPHNPVVLDGNIHWVAYYDFMGKNDEFVGDRIISCDLTSEEFGEVDLPDSLVGHRYMDISKLNESLVVLDYKRGDAGCDVWMMLKNGVPKSSFTKLFTVKAFSNSIIGFRKNAQPIILRGGELKVYELGSGHMNGLGIYSLFFNMASYTESLLLLNHSDSII